MENFEKHKEFIDLRAKGWSYSKISEKIGVSKPTLIEWGKKYCPDIENLRAIGIEALKEKYLALKEQRVTLLGERLKEVREKLAGKDLSALNPLELLGLEIRLLKALRGEDSEVESNFRDKPLNPKDENQKLEGQPTNPETDKNLDDY